MNETPQQQRGVAQNYLDVAGVVLVVIDANQKVNLINRKGCQVLGYKEQEIIGKNWFDNFIPDRIRGEVRAVFDKLMAGEIEPVEYFENPVLTKNGEERIIAWHNTVLMEEGNIIGTLSSGEDITERKRAEEMLQASEERHRAYFENVSDIICSVDTELRFLDVSPSVERVLGYKPEELAGRRFTDIGFLTPDSLSAAVSQVSRSLAGEYAGSVELQFITRDGRTKFLELHGVPLFRGGKLTALVGIARDITERKQAEEERTALLEHLRHQQAAVVKLARSAVIAAGEPRAAAAEITETAANVLQVERVSLWLGSREEGKIQCLDLYEKSKGCHSEGMVLWADQYPRYFEELASGRAIDACDARNDPRTCEFREGYLNPLGITSMLDAAVRMAGRIVGVVCHEHVGKPRMWAAYEIRFAGEIADQAAQALLNVERKKVEEALQASEEQYRLLVENANEAIIVAQDGMLKFANRRTAELTGYSREELILMPFAKLIHPDDRDMVIERHFERLKGGMPPSVYSFRFIRKDGSIGWLEINAVLMIWEGKPATLNFLTNITERKKAEEERRNLELTAQISSRLASVGEMTAGIAHEINNPLTAVIGYAQLLMDRKDIPFDTRKDLAAINEGAQRVAGIVKRLLAFSRQTKPERRLVDINELIESTLALRAYHLSVNNIKVTTKLAPDVLETVADPGQMQQVLLNLIVNAETEMKLAHGKGKLTITTEKSDNTIKISVKDNGPGIKPEVMDKIFDPFFTTREVGQGTGLGLSLCYGIVAEHKGKIYAESKPGKGATFIVELPVITEAELPEPPEPVVEQPEEVAKARILVVDDEKVIRDLVKRVLSGEGYQVDTADNADDALNMIEGKRYNLILLDIKMPGMGGAELYRRIQKIAKSLARRVVFITGDIMGADTEKFLSETKVARIDKPFNAEQLRREVKRALTGGR